MQKPGIKTILAVSSAIFILLIIFISKGCGNKEGRELVFEKISKGNVKKTISVIGELDILDPLTILSKANGIVEKIYVDFNKKVSKGEILLRVDSSIIDQQIIKAQGSLENAKFKIVSAEQDLQGKKNLFKDNLISKRAMENSEIEYNSVLLLYKQTKMDYNLLLKERAYSKVYSPISGTIVTVYAKENSPVGTNTPLFLLAPTLSKMLLTISVDESDIGYIKNGQQVVFTVSAFPDKRFEGKINQVRINPIKSGGLVTYQSLVTCDNPELLLRPGMTATATVVVDEKRDVLMVLNQALIISPEENVNSDNTKKIVWKKTGIIEGKTYKPLEVKAGLQGDMYTEITGGLNENDEILVRIKEKK
jgi:HlyD family secretion protein